jgi:DNA polymerase-3 subunit gamma/tau
MPYTAQEKFAFLAERNPHLMELKEALGLDTEF